MYYSPPLLWFGNGELKQVSVSEAKSKTSYFLKMIEVTIRENIKYNVYSNIIDIK